MNAPPAGLCERCIHCKTISSARGQAFFLCALHQRDARFAKYPRLPVIDCSGYAPEEDAERPSGRPR